MKYRRFTVRLALIATVLTLASVSALAQAWPSWHFPAPQCQGCFVASHVDTPAAGSEISGYEAIWTWGGVCNTGAVPTHVEATAVVHGSAHSVQPSYIIGGEREDVRSHLQSQGCDGGHAVVPVWFPSGLPAGTTLVAIRLHYEDISAGHGFTVAASLLRD